MTCQRYQQNEVNKSPLCGLHQLCMLDGVGKPDNYTVRHCCLPGWPVICLIRQDYI